uniref:Fatty acid desaturase domain-containing protein n=1 Tax=Glossina morsitans morsitans TaxID=37546 RepID=A0A1B0GE34_GLOMM
MGHLSTSERVITTSVEQTESSLKKRLNNVAATGNEFNEFPKKNGQKLMTSSNNVDSNVNYKTNYHTNLEEYTRNFKGDSVLGIQFKAPLKWDKIIMIFSFYFLSVFYLITYPLNKLRLPTILWAFLIGILGGFGVTGGAHRLWTHRSFKANLPLRIILMLCFSAAGQNSLYDWVRDHRVHHKYSETDADPHNSNRGFFFSHVGWLMMYKHPEVLRRGRQIDMKDVLDDPVVLFHEKYFIPLKILCCFLLPTIVPIYGWGEEVKYALISQCVFRYICSLNFTWSVNSAAHMWGNRPYDKRINPTENVYVSVIALGEGWHNYHHVFPWDYKAAELGKYSFNYTTMFLDAFSKLGWCWDMKQPSKELIQRTYEKYGDGSHALSHGVTLTDTNSHIPEVPDPELEVNSNIDLIKLDENENVSKKICTLRD